MRLIREPDDDDGYFEDSMCFSLHPSTLKASIIFGIFL
jgi:hypothetical protein